MSALPLLFPETVEIECQDGTTKTFVLGKFPAIAGRELVTMYPLTAVPKVGDYKSNMDVVRKLMHFVEVPAEVDEQGTVIRPAIRLTTDSLIDNHVPDFEALYRLEFALIQKNCSFFQNGKGRSLVENLAQNSMGKLMNVLTQWLPQLLARAEQASKN